MVKFDCTAIGLCVTLLSNTWLTYRYLVQSIGQISISTYEWFTLLYVRYIDILHPSINHTILPLTIGLGSAINNKKKFKK